MSLTLSPVANMQDTHDVVLGDVYVVAEHGLMFAMRRNHKRGTVTLAEHPDGSGERVTVPVTSLWVPPLGGDVAPAPVEVPASAAPVAVWTGEHGHAAVVVPFAAGTTGYPLPTYADAPADTAWAVTYPDGRPVVFGPERPPVVKGDRVRNLRTGAIAEVRGVATTHTRWADVRDYVVTGDVWRAEDCLLVSEPVPALPEYATGPADVHLAVECADEDGSVCPLEFGPTWPGVLCLWGGLCVERTGQGWCVHCASDIGPEERVALTHLWALRPTSAPA